MGALMSEYVVQAVIRHYRYLDDDEKSMRAGGWDQFRHEPRDNFPVGVMGLGTLGQQVARALAFFGFPVNGWSRRSEERRVGKECGSKGCQVQYRNGGRYENNMKAN